MMHRSINDFALQVKLQLFVWKDAAARQSQLAEVSFAGSIPCAVRCLEKAGREPCSHGRKQVEVAHHTGEEVVAQPLSALGKSVGGQRRNHQAVRPAPQLYVQDWIPHLLPLPPLLLIP